METLNNTLPLFAEIEDENLQVIAEEYIQHHISLEEQKMFAALHGEVVSTLPLAIKVLRGFQNYETLENVNVFLKNYDVFTYEYKYKVPAHLMVYNTDVMMDYALLGLAANLTQELNEAKKLNCNAQFIIKNLVESVSIIVEKTMGAQIVIKSSYEIS